MEKFQKIAITRKLDDLGRIVLPIEVRKQLGWSKNETLEITTLNDGIFLQKNGSSCLLCGSPDDLTTVRGRTICKICCEEISKQFLEK